MLHFILVQLVIFPLQLYWNCLHHLFACLREKVNLDNHMRCFDYVYLDRCLAFHVYIILSTMKRNPCLCYWLCYVDNLLLVYLFLWSLSNEGACLAMSVNISLTPQVMLDIVWWSCAINLTFFPPSGCVIERKLTNKHLQHCNSFSILLKLVTWILPLYAIRFVSKTMSYFTWTDTAFNLETGNDIILSFILRWDLRDLFSLL